MRDPGDAPLRPLGRARITDGAAHTAAAREAEALGWVRADQQWLAHWYLGGACRRVVSPFWTGPDLAMYWSAVYFDPDRVVAVGSGTFGTEADALRAALDWRAIVLG